MSALFWKYVVLNVFNVIFLLCKALCAAFHVMKGAIQIKFIIILFCSAFFFFLFFVPPSPFPLHIYCIVLCFILSFSLSMLYELKKDPNWNNPKSFFVVFILLVDLVPVNCTVMTLYLFPCKLETSNKNLNQSIKTPIETSLEAFWCLSF